MGDSGPPLLASTYPGTHHFLQRRGWGGVGWRSSLLTGLSWPPTQSTYTVLCCRYSVPKTEPFRGDLLPKHSSALSTPPGTIWVDTCFLHHRHWPPLSLGHIRGRSPPSASACPLPPAVSSLDTFTIFLPPGLGLSSTLLYLILMAKHSWTHTNWHSYF